MASIFFEANWVGIRSSIPVMHSHLLLQMGMLGGRRGRAAELFLCPGFASNIFKRAELAAHFFPASTSGCPNDDFYDVVTVAESTSSGSMFVSWFDFSKAAKTNSIKDCVSGLMEGFVPSSLFLQLTCSRNKRTRTVNGKGLSFSKAGTKQHADACSTL